MKFYLSVFTLFLSLVSFSQNGFTAVDARKVVDTFFEGFHEGDTLKMRSVMVTNVAMQTAFTDTNGNAKINDGSASDLLMAIAKRPATQKWEERVLDYNVQIDGNLAHVWTPYQFWFNDALSHCGANAFTLAKTDDGWKIVHLIDSRRKSDCQ
ncbi:putative lumazine-binding protein [Ulvibacter sp. MAR_2010_11]|uniref:nuclear transport factor 2 family protein n=1 Tax=Ulvibacter sp. MAR_2010_11 TaxID=1250229 RepID=UPI000C2B98AE|nr:nuclear transport factor 2 family protein [Ulvibacter sp. MAR_2010_11]PKA84420.1 putative lumazine-binding protein [Ulvibacter sp. MAR_2010_11]